MRLREILLRDHAVDAGVLAQAEQMAATTGAPLVHILVRYQIIEGKRLARLLSRAIHVDLIDVCAVEIHARMLEVVPRHAAERLRVLPIGIKRSGDSERLFLAMSDPTDNGIVDYIEKATGRTVEIMCCDDEALGRSFDLHYGIIELEPAVLVGVLDSHRVLEAGGEFLTESTAEALRLVETSKTIDLPELTPGGGDEGLQHIDTIRHPRPVSMALAAALAEATAEAQRIGQRVMPALEEVWGDVSSTSLHLAQLATLPPDASALDPEEELFEISPLILPIDTDLTAPTTRVVVPASLMAEATPAPDVAPKPAPKTGAKPAVFLSTPTGLTPTDRAALRDELNELLGPIDLDDDAVAACRKAARARAVVLLAARPQSALLRALLDLEEMKPRPRIVILGGDPSLHILDFVDHHAEMPDLSLGPRAVAVAIVVALRQVGVRL